MKSLRLLTLAFLNGSVQAFVAPLATKRSSHFLAAKVAGDEPLCPLLPPPVHPEATFEAAMA